MSDMKQIRVEKVTLNIGVGGPGEKLEKAIKLLKTISASKPIAIASSKRIPTWGVRPGLQLASKVTVRGKKAEELLMRLLQAVDNKLPRRKFDKFGNFSFGIHEYIDIPGVQYDPSIGVIGLEAAVTLQRPGFRVKRRAVKVGKIGIKHRITAEDSIAFVKNKFNVKVGDEE